MFMRMSVEVFALGYVSRSENVYLCKQKSSNIWSAMNDKPLGSRLFECLLFGHMLLMSEAMMSERMYDFIQLTTHMMA